MWLQKLYKLFLLAYCIILTTQPPASTTFFPSCRFFFLFFISNDYVLSRRFLQPHKPKLLPLTLNYSISSYILCTSIRDVVWVNTTLCVYNNICIAFICWCCLPYCSRICFVQFYLSFFLACYTVILLCLFDYNMNVSAFAVCFSKNTTCL